MQRLCRDCLTTDVRTGRCPVCGSPRVVAHDELFSLTIAHVDCDAFYAAVEKRERPELRDRPVIIGGGRRGVVSTACYIARIRGVRSAMPMFKALELCPDAEVLRPRLELYSEVSRQIRDLMCALTPAVEPLSLDEAFLDLSGTERLHHAPAAVLLARLVRQIEEKVGVTASVGLSHNKFLAKIASDLDKPRGFSVIGRAETEAFLADKPVGIIWGVGPSLRMRLAAAGIETVGDLRRWDADALIRRFGSMGERLWHLARGRDSRPVAPDAPVKSISRETTFATDTADRERLDGHLFRLAEEVADRAKARALSGRTVTLKLKRSDHRLVTRRHALDTPTQLADRIYREGRALLDAVTDPGPWRLLGIGISDLRPEAEADLSSDLLDPDALKRARAERAADTIRARFGRDAIIKGRALR